MLENFLRKKNMKNGQVPKLRDNIVQVDSSDAMRCKNLKKKPFFPINNKLKQNTRN
jgi:hypothetical protein